MGQLHEPIVWGIWIWSRRACPAPSAMTFASMLAATSFTAANLSSLPRKKLLCGAGARRLIPSYPGLDLRIDVM